MGFVFSRASAAFVSFRHKCPFDPRAKCRVVPQGYSRSNSIWGLDDAMLLTVDLRELARQN